MCLLCDLYEDKENIVMENETCFLVRHSDSKLHGHMLIATKKHKDSYFNLTYKENEDIFMLSKNCKSYLDSQISPDAYNIGYNIGSWAGQEFNHVHMHIIPRFAGDVPITELKGGVTNSITSFKEGGK